MFELKDVSLLVDAKPQELVLLGDVTAVFPPGELVAVVGQPGSGKSTLLKLLAGVRQPTFGEVLWTGDHFGLPRIAYLPQGAADGATGKAGLLTVAEQVATALRLRLAGVSPSDCNSQVEALLERAGLAALAEAPVRNLNLDQARRLAVITELTGCPAMILCDETGGAFDPRTEQAHAQWLHALAREGNRAIVNVTHALDTLGSYDSVIVLHGGQLAYQGPPEFLTQYFQITSDAELYEQLATLRPDECHRLWVKQRKLYQTAQGQKQMVTRLEEHARRRLLERIMESQGSRPVPRPTSGVAGAIPQFFTLLQRRWRQAARDLPALWLQLALLLGLPFAAALFTADALPQWEKLSQQITGNVADQLQGDTVFAALASNGVGIVVGLAMAQMILLAFMTVQNAGGEIAGERMSLEREKFSGLHVGAYVASKAAFLLPFVLLQAAWMGAYVHHVCQLPGSLAGQIAVLALVNAAFAALFLAVSSLARFANRAVMTCFVLALLQLPFSGTVLAPPMVLSWITRPLAAIYWGAGAYLQSMQGTRFHELLPALSPVPLSPLLLCLVILSLQIALSLAVALYGCKIARVEITRKHPGT